MADYNSMKVPELKKLLQGRTLSVTGNKADLVARLAENDKQNAPTATEPAAAAPAAAEANDVEITWSEDEDEPAKPAAAAKETAPAAVEAAAPATEAAAAAAPATETAESAAPAEAAAAATTTEDAAPAAPAEPEVPKEDFALHLSATDVAKEAQKRAERAKRFGIADDQGANEVTKKAERAARFGADEKNDIASSLDAALPERRPKRGRGEGDRDQGGQDSKRQTTGGRNQGQAQAGGRRGRGRQQPQQQQGGRRQQPPRENSGRKQAAAPVDGAEKARMDARAKRFAAS
ncbi:hypothetical protein ACHAQA_005951 [Verticillium albo-atrum]